jgi:hypothetical protein
MAAHDRFVLAQLAGRLDGAHTVLAHVRFANSPPGMRVGAKASGLFKSVELDRG